MRDPGAMGVFEGVGDLDHQRHRAFRRQRAALRQQLPQRAAFDVLVDQIGAVAERPDVVDLHDARMAQAAGGTGFVQQTAGAAAVRVGIAQHLDRDDALDLGIAGQKDGTVRALAQGP